MPSDYREDLAQIHHHGFSEFAASAAPFVIDVFRKHDVRFAIEIGCGSGILARELTRAGFDLLGIDASPAMIALARTTATAARFEVASFDKASLPPCDAIVAMGEVLNYGDLRTFLPRAAEAIRPGGLLLFDLAERGAYPAYEERRAGGVDWSVIVIKESDGTTLTRRILTFRDTGEEIRRDEETHTLELYDREEVLTLLRDFSVNVRRSYGSQRLPKGHAVYLASKRARKSGGRRGQASFVRPKMR